MAQGPFIIREPDYSDLDLDFFANRSTKDVVRKTGEEAIKRSVRNLIFTSFYDRPFRSDRKSTRLNSSHMSESRMPSSA